MGITHKILSFRILQYCIRNNDFKKITSLENTDLNYLIRRISISAQQRGRPSSFSVISREIRDSSRNELRDPSFCKILLPESNMMCILKGIRNTDDCFIPFLRKYVDINM